MRKGQALISLIFISVIGITVATAATMLVLINSFSALDLQQSTLAFEVAQSGAENALLRVLRNPSYAGESNMAVDGGSVDILISSPSGIFIATASGKIGNYVRKVQVQAHFDDNYVLVVDSRKEIWQ